MVQDRRALSGRSGALVLAALLLVLEGCVVYPSAVPLKDQDTATAARDASECREQAERDTPHPMAAGLGTKLFWALGGAAVGAALVWPVGYAASIEHNVGNDAPKWVAIAAGAGAALGFVVGSIAGTWRGADEASHAKEAREKAFARCMAERGYRTQ